MAGRADGTTQHTWTVLYHPAASGGAALDLAEADYDADTGELIRANTFCDLEGQPNVPGSERARLLTANDAVAEARAWLSKLGLWAGQTEASPVVFAPQKSSCGNWRVWLRGRETPGGPPLTVAVALNSRTEAYMEATIVERAALPSFYLPRAAPRR
jgi:hypothetical protein